MRLRPALALLMIAGLPACDRADEDQITSNHEEGAANSATGIPAANELASAYATFDRFGPIRIGASLADLESEGLVVAGRDDALPGSTCAYARFRGLDGVAVMLDGERIVRIDISGRQHEGPHGLRVGQSEDDAIHRLGRPQVKPHPYTGPLGHYLVLLDAGAGTALIAETDGKTVERWRIGQQEQVQWIEGCA